MISFSDRYRTASAIRRLAQGDEDYVTTLGQIADRLRTRVPSGVTVEVEQTGGGVQNIILERGETRIYVGDASGNVGWSDEYGEQYGEFEDLFFEDPSDHDEIVNRLSEVARDIFGKTASKTAITLTEWSVSVTSPNRWMSTPGVWDGYPNAILNVHKTVDEPNEFGGIGKSVKHPEYDGLTFDSVDEAWAFAESKGLVSKRGSKTAAPLSWDTDTTMWTGSRKTATDPYGIWATTPGATGIAPGFEGKTYKPYKYTPDNTTQPGRNWAVIVELPDGDIDFMADGLSAEEAYEDAKRWNANPFLAPDHSQFHDDTMFGLIQGGRVAKDVQWSANQPPSDRVYLIDTNVEPIPYRPGGGDAAASFLWPRAEAERAIGEHRPGWRYPAREIADPKDGWYVSWGPSVHAGGDNYWNLNNRNFARREARHREVARRKRANEIMGYEDEKELEADEPENMVPVAASVPAQGRVSDWRRTAELTAEDCIDSADGTCSGEVEYRMPLSSSGKSFPQCHRHWLKRLNREQDNPYPDDNY